ncbi:MAG: tRNA (adenosine(37)-N6)-threonylcarbamoyltransferase complex ATPase subunit type 1 TsaE [Alphaproteobacteria bacterium]|jgi:tRNA threonylcarbamoyladenosine biosynthesis protein TsaE
MYAFCVQNRAALEKAAADLAKLCRPKDVIALFGDLGMGKTVFARAFIRSFGRPEEEVPSPTFTLVQTYDVRTGNGGETAVWHFDLYRLKHPDEIYETGFEEALSDGISLIEWPERAGNRLPGNRLEIHLSAGASPDERRVEIIPLGKTWKNRTDWETYAGTH